MPGWTSPGISGLLRQRESRCSGGELDNHGDVAEHVAELHGWIEDALRCAVVDGQQVTGGDPRAPLGLVSHRGAADAQLLRACGRHGHRQAPGMACIVLRGSPT